MIEVIVRPDIEDFELGELIDSTHDSVELNNVIQSKLSSNVEACGINKNNIISLEEINPNSLHNSRLPDSSNSFLGAVHLAFAHHYPLVLSPDSIWTCIAQGFAEHVNQNSEVLRKHFVQHDGKETIIVRRDFFSKGNPDNDWQGCFAEFSNSLQKFLGKKRDLVVSNFSTTGPIEKAVSEIVLMDSMKSYFKYEVHTRCGIPKIILMGTEKDWEDIYFRAEALSEYDLSWWTKELLPVLEKIHNTFTGASLDISFWKSLYKINNESGGPTCDGWINTLFPYITNYKKQYQKNSSIDKWNNSKPIRFGSGESLDAFPPGISCVPFKWLYYDKEFDMEFLGGFVGINQDEKSKALTPVLGWAVREQAK